MAAETHTEMEKISMLLAAVETSPAAASDEPEKADESGPDSADSETVSPQAAHDSKTAPAANEAADVSASEPEFAPEKESYIALARRAANASMTQKNALAPQKVEKPKRERSEPKPKGAGAGRTRLVLLGCAAPLVIVAAAVIVLNRHPVSAQTAKIQAPAPAVVASSRPQRPPLVIATQPAAASATPATADPPAVPAIRPLPDENPAAQTAAVTPVKSLPETAILGDAKSERELGLKYLSGQGVPANDEEAVRWLLRAAYHGEPTAEYWLGTLYERGRGVPEDLFQARHWYEAAAKKGNRTAMHNLAVADLNGHGAEKNVEEAIQWFTKAAELGVADSQFNLALLYERGTGVTQNLSEAYKWYAIAAAGGDKEAVSRLAILANQLKPEDLAKARSAAAAFKPAPVDASANAAGGPANTQG